MGPEGTPVVSRYPQRSRKKVKYEEFEMSLVEDPTYKRKTKKDSDDSSFSEDEENENDNSNVNEEVAEEEISEYEKMRLKNLEENKRIMMELGIIHPKKETKVKLRSVQAKVSKLPKAKAPKIMEPTKRSLRLLRKTPEGKDMQLDIFQDTPPGTPPIKEKEEKLRIYEEELPMGKDSEEIDFLDSLKASLSQDSDYCSQSTENLIKDMRDLEFAAIQKVNQNRIQSMCVHPMENKLLVVSGSTSGELGLWDASAGELGQFTPHVRPINCVSVSTADHSQLFTTSFDGTLRRADVNKSIFHMVYQTNEEARMSHLTWHSQIDASSLLVAHGTGDAAVVDMRVDKSPQRWFNCHDRSIRTLHLHPTQPHYFLTSSGIGESNIFDLRGGQREVSGWVSCLTGAATGKGLTSAFFSPDGNRVVTTCNDDYIHIYDTSNISEPKKIHRTMHDNHTGRWLSVFKTIWHPQSSDIMFVGSMLHPRRVQIITGSGKLMREIRADELSTVVSVLAYHSSLPVLVGGNSTGKAHIFTTSSWADRILNQQEL